MKLAEISIKRPSLVIVLFTILTLGGLLSYSMMGYELIPKFETNMVTISTVYPGASPAEVETSVTRKIEDAVGSLENVKKVESSSYESLSVIMVQLNTGADVNYALNDAQRKVNAILADLPDDADPPSLQKFSLDDLPIMTLSISSDKLNNKDLYDLLDKKIEPIFSRVNGVAQVDLVGGQEREIQVNLDEKKMQGYGIAIADVQQAILSSNLDFPTGALKTRTSRSTIRLSGKYKSVDEMNNLVVSNKNGAQVRLSDIATVFDTQKDVEKVARYNQNSTILLQVKKQSDANAVSVSELVKKTIADVQKNYKTQAIKINIVDDTTDFTLEAADHVIFDLFLAIILVAVVMLLFLHNIRNAFIVMVSIPMSLIATVIGMYLMGYTLNLMSLLGLSLVVGILVDDAIVVLENVYRHMEMGKSRIRAAYDGASEIGFTVTAITLVIVVVFLPIAMSSGLVSDILAQFCVTVVIATLFSLLASFTIIPWLSSRYGKLVHLTGKNPFEKFILWFEKQLEKFTHWITGILEWALKTTLRRIMTVVVTFIILISSFMLVAFGFIGGEFFPKMDRGQFLVQMELPKDASVEKTNQLTLEVERYLRNDKDVVDMITTVGQQSSGFGGAQATLYQSEIQVILVDKSERNESTDIKSARIKRALEEKFTGVEFKTAPIGLMGADNAPIEMVVTAQDNETANKEANRILELLKKVPGSVDAELSTDSGNPEVQVNIDRDKMASLGLNLSSVGQTMQTAFSGNTDGKFRAGEYEYDINIRFGDANRQSIDDVRNLMFTNPQGEQIRLSQFAEVKMGSGPSLLERRDKAPSVKVKSKVVGRPVGDVANEWAAQFMDNEKTKPAGVSYIWSGDMENQTEGFGTLGIALMAAIVLVYLVMVSLYDSFVYPFVVLFSIPLALIGVMVILAITANSLNIFTMLGMIMLIGLVAKNAIMIVDFANMRKEAGASTHDALIQANHARLRPILMTTIAMIFGMIPIAIAKGAGAEMNNGLAWVIIGGLTSSLFLTLIIVPVVYSLFDSILRRMGKHEKVDYEAEMKADYVHKELSEDGFTPKHVD
ncbi:MULTISPECIES: efflux RND transporter permease subunit [Chryseobacterium]|jgi:HAE1 family hydrophobic/amphiphilic exporter-1|uniref:AcrB/AcrD/AcrF family protein n=1 Tax=Chryseobacterium rhizosphaerae TaxID=395937 RepID=A0AAE3Y5Z7_9FLAO|nr:MULTISPECIES: efflux RND transporter permease subunit [Chryseobacterium]MBL3546702.1 efflux RND transporter permease subunit [Chryseobacterium sp. KMC2]MDC8099841.1 efflux RND transporter permease subunit [Chryseobacterium rhizosphaerae]MDR6524667.1 HAE1 family hydrophobic/amphiphilic exporter-1 [Chryseobacterium rhizosphaerae]MDR6548570.1 HAE1 family hydrophobic/amphiphilic exporter-1 [Chryseobacterium rhizosphaerae]REC73478.1 AcrB/AcrD/AcrF family protein [Chryseobacterium rhizosphaerae]